MLLRWTLIVAAATAVLGCGQVTPVVDATPPPDGSVDGSTTPTVRVTVVRGGAAPGTISSVPAGIDCGATCVGTFPVGTLVTLTASPGAGAAFAGWGGACSGTLTTCSLSLTADVAVNADFAVLRHTVTVTAAGSGGRIVSSPAGIDCPGTCMTTVDHGTQLSFMATPGGGSTFLGWSGACTGTGACSVTVNADVQLSGAFGQSQTLVVTRTGNGHGTITSSPPGINCGTDCAEVYPPATMVTLAATADPDSNFLGWGGACTGTGPCTVTINAATAVDARFELKRFTLTAIRTGMGSGTITNLSPTTGIACGTDCTEDYDYGTMVSLLATPAADNTFGGWTGDCTNMFGPCTVAMTQARTVRATFTAAPTVVLTLSVYGAGSVRASPSPVMGPSVCSSTDPNTTTCQLTFNRGTAVALTAVYSAPFTLIDVSGCSRMGDTCSVTMDASKAAALWFCSTTGMCPI